jgi:ribosomal protein S18 acetylase RimI-like enzyme
MDAPTSVCVVKLDDVDNDIKSDNGRIRNELSVGWLESYCCLSGLGTGHVTVLGSILENIVPQKAFFALNHDARTVSVGLGVLERGHLGLFNIVSDEKRRNQGLGKQMVSYMLQWGRANGAQHAYLAVMHSNVVARHLYNNLGFREAYSYWYRVKTTR